MWLSCLVRNSCNDFICLVKPERNLYLSKNKIIGPKKEVNKTSGELQVDHDKLHKSMNKNKRKWLNPNESVG